MNSTKSAKEIPYVKVKIQGNMLRMTVDTGATINVLDRHTFDQMTNINLQPTNVKAYTYDTTTPVKFLGKFEAAISTGGCRNVLCGVYKMPNRPGAVF